MKRFAIGVVEDVAGRLPGNVLQQIPWTLLRRPVVYSQVPHGWVGDRREHRVMQSSHGQNIMLLATIPVTNWAL